MSDADVEAQFLVVARRELAESHARIVHAVTQLSDADVWWRPFEQQNAVGNILLHLSGNLRQWIVSGVGGAADTRDRPAEFAERRPIAKRDLLEKLANTVAEADHAIARCTAAELLRVRHVQHGPQSGMAAIFHSVSHLIGHAQEIVYITRLRLGNAYQFKGISGTSK